MILKESIASAGGLPGEDQATMRRLIRIYNRHESANRKKRRYYEGHITLAEVNLGLAIPKAFRELEIGCAWGAKTVDVLAARSMFDGFVGRSGEEAAEMDRIVHGNRLLDEYRKACRDELKYGCTFATLSADPLLGCRIRWHSPENAAAEWDGTRGRIGSGFAIISYSENAVTGERKPNVIHYYTDTHLWVLARKNDSEIWTAEGIRHAMGRPLMVPFVWDATTKKPFGRSRLKEAVRRLIQGYVRTMANATIGLEFSTSPQKYLLGVTDEQYDAVINASFRNYIGSILAATNNPDTGANPTFGQLSQGTITPHVEMMRLLSTQFSAATGLSVTDTGVINDANPTSSDAILAQSQTLILMAEQLNAGNGDSLQTLAMMAQAIARNVSPDRLTENELNVIPHFKNPAMPSIAATADAALKIASCRPGFAGTRVFLEMVGFDQADIRRIEAQEKRNRGLQLVEELVTEEVTAE